MTVGEKLKILRGSMTQQDLADTLNASYGHMLPRPVTRDTLANYELDRWQFGWEVARAIVMHFGISLDDLIMEDRALPEMKRKRRPKAIAA